MNVLYMPQWSMISDGEYCINRDGNYTVILKFMKILSKFKNVRMYILYREQENLHSGLEKVKEITAASKEYGIEVVYLKTDYSLIPIINRFDFDTTFYAELITEFTIDLIINNIPELTANFRFLEIITKRKVPIVSFNHFPDLHDGTLLEGIPNSYWYRQLDCLEHTDLYLFNCDSIADEFYKKAKSCMSYEKFMNLRNKIHTLYLLDLQVHEATEKSNYVVFPARITETLYTNWDWLFDVALRNNIPTIFCNPSLDKGIAAIHKNFDVDLVETTYLGIKCLRVKNIIIINERTSKEQYYEVLKSAKYSVSLYFKEAYGGLAIREAVTIGNTLPIAPNIFEFSKWYKDVARLTHNNFTNFSSFEDMLMIVLGFNEQRYLDIKTSIISNLLESEDSEISSDAVTSVIRSLV